MFYCKKKKIKFSVRNWLKIIYRTEIWGPPVCQAISRIWGQITHQIRHKTPCRTPYPWLPPPPHGAYILAGIKNKGWGTPSTVTWQCATEIQLPYLISFLRVLLSEISLKLHKIFKKILSLNCPSSHFMCMPRFI